LDIFYVHYWDFTMAIQELLHGLNDLIVSGQVFLGQPYIIYLTELL